MNSSAQNPLENLDASTNNADAFFHRGNACLPLNHFEEALENYEQALAIQPNHAQALSNRGNIFIIQERFEQALDSFDRALAIQPNYADALANRGTALMHLQRFDEALASFNQAVTLHINHAGVFFNQGTVLLRLQRFEEALTSFDRALALRPDDAMSVLNRGAALHGLQHFDMALACFDQAVAMQPQNVEIRLNRGGALQRLNRFEEALADYAYALTLQPDYAEAHWNESICRLTMGDFALGWQKYEWRWKRKQSMPSTLFTQSITLRHFPQPLWLGKESLRNKTILLHAEQGLGDTIQFCRYAQLIATLGATVIMEVQPSLKNLLRHLPGVTDIVAQGEELPDFDLHCPLLSLPLACNTTLHSIPVGNDNIHAPPSSDTRSSLIVRIISCIKRCLPKTTSTLPAMTGSYLRADPLHKALWQNKLGAKTLPRIGLTWSGSTTHVNDRHRSIPLVDFLGIIDVQNKGQQHAQFYCLQQELRPNDQTVFAQRLEQQNKITFLGNDLQDFADTAALISLMDLVITVDTSVAHLAGAMGKPVWILLPFNADWRWLTDRNDSPWYPSARLFRQPAIGDWSSVIATVKRELSKHA